MYEPNAEIPATIADSSDRSPIVFHDLSVDDMRGEPGSLDDWLGYLMPGRLPC